MGCRQVSNVGTRKCRIGATHEARERDLQVVARLVCRVERIEPEPGLPGVRKPLVEAGRAVFAEKVDALAATENERLRYRRAADHPMAARSCRIQSMAMALPFGRSSPG